MDARSDDVLAVSDARAQLTGILRTFRAADGDGEPVAIGAHRRVDAVLVPIARYRLLTEGATGRLLPELRRRRATIERLAHANRIERVRVFGSAARREDSDSSDVDLLVDPAPDATLFDLAQFEMDVEALLDRPVDVVSSRALDPARDGAILAEAMPL